MTTTPAKTIEKKGRPPQDLTKVINNLEKQVKNLKDELNPLEVQLHYLKEHANLHQPAQEEHEDAELSDS